MKKIIKLQGWFRLFLWGYCPNCNGDAPKCYDCKVCLRWHVENRYKKPSFFIKQVWWDFFKYQLEKNEKNLNKNQR